MTSSGQLSMPLTEEYRKWQAIRDRQGEPAVRGYFIERCREYARTIWKERAKRQGADSATVSTDDLRPYVEHIMKVPDWLSLNFMGCVFRFGEWEPVGFKRSEVEGSHGNLIRVWTRDERLYRERGE